MIRLTLFALIAAAPSSYRGCACYWPTQQDVRVAAAVLQRENPNYRSYSADISRCDEIRFYAPDDPNHEGPYDTFRRVNGKWVHDGGVIWVTRDPL